MTSGPLRISILFSAIILFGVIVSSAIASEIKLSPDPGQYRDNIRVSMGFPENWIVYYTLDGSNPTINSSIYSAPINIEEDTVLRYFEIKPGSSSRIIKEAFYGISRDDPDEDELRTIADPPGGVFSGRISVSMTSRDGATIYYTIDGSEPATQSPVYTAPMLLANDTVLRFFSMDRTGEREPVREVLYTFRLTDKLLDTTPPTIVIDPTPERYIGDERIKLRSDEESTIYYTLDGTEPTENSFRYTDPILLEKKSVIKFFGIDSMGNRSSVGSAEYILDVTPPSTIATPPTGLYKLPQNVTLSASEDDAVIYYTLHGFDPTEGSSIYKDAIAVKDDTVIKYFAVDKYGNAESVNTSEYLFDDTPPVTRPNLPAGEYFPPVSVLLSTEPGSVIRYTIDGSDPDLGSPLYTGDDIVFRKGGTLKFFAVDQEGNRESIQEYTYNLFKGVWRKYARGVFLIPSATDGKVFWMGTDTGLIRYQVGSGSRKFIGEREGLLGSEINDLVLDENGILWVASDLGLNRYVDDEGFMRFDHEGGLPGRAVLSMGVDTDNTIWAGTMEGVAQIKGDIILQILTEKDGLIDNAVLSVAVDALGNKWFGTSKGLSMYADGKWNHYTKADGLIHNEVRTVAVDSRWNIWIGTPRGISVYDGADWKSYTRKDGLPSNSIVLITPDPDGDVWIATRAGVIRFSAGEWIMEESP